MWDFNLLLRTEVLYSRLKLMSKTVLFFFFNKIAERMESTTTKQAQSKLSDWSTAVLLGGEHKVISCF